MGTLSLDEPILEAQRQVSTAQGLALHEGASQGCLTSEKANCLVFLLYSFLGAGGLFMGLLEAACPLSV